MMIVEKWFAVSRKPYINAEEQNAQDSQRDSKSCIFHLIRLLIQQLFFKTGNILIYFINLIKSLN